MAYHDGYQNIYNLAKDCLKNLREMLPELKSTRPAMEEVWGSDVLTIPWYAKPRTEQIECEQLGTSVDVLCLVTFDTAASNTWNVSVYMHPVRKTICISCEDGNHLQVNLDKPDWAERVVKHLKFLNEKLILMERY